MELVISYIAKAIVLFTSMALYVYLFSSIIPKFIMQLRCKKENTCDRGIKKFIYPNGRCILYETELKIRGYVSSYVLYTENGYKYLKCRTAQKINRLRYDVYAFDNKNKLIDIVEVNEVIGYNEYSNAVLLPPETSYARFVLRKADSLYASKEIVAVYPLWQYIVCASVVALATACESAIIYLLSRNLILNALRLKIALSSPILMLIFTVAISLIVAGLTVLAYRRKCKKVINR